MKDPDPNTPSDPIGSTIKKSKAIDDTQMKANCQAYLEAASNFWREFHQKNPDPRIPQKLIPLEILEQALAEAALPAFVRDVGKHTVEICETVADLKAARKLGKSPSAHIPRLLKLFSEALADEDWTAMDDFVKAWENTKTKPRNVFYGGEDYPFSEPPDPEDTIRKPLAWIVVDCIMQLQRDLGRIPFRSEILNYVTFHRPEEGMDDAELSRQLKKLHLAKWIPKKTKAAEKAAEEWD